MKRDTRPSTHIGVSERSGQATCVPFAMVECCDFRLALFDLGAVRGGMSSAERLVPRCAASGGESHCDDDPPSPDEPALGEEDPSSDRCARLIGSRWSLKAIAERSVRAAFACSDVYRLRSHGNDIHRFSCSAMYFCRSADVGGKGALTCSSVSNMVVFSTRLLCSSRVCGSLTDCNGARWLRLFWSLGGRGGGDCD